MDTPWSIRHLSRFDSLVAFSLLTLPTDGEPLQVELEYFAHGGILHYVLRSLKRKG